MPEFQDEVFKSVRVIIQNYCESNNIPKEEGVNFFNDLQKEAFKNQHELLSEVSSACQRLWTSGLSLRGREFCSILNEIIRTDMASCMTHDVAVICRGINSLCVNRLNQNNSKVEWPQDHRLYRGGGLPNDKREFFEVGRVYRCPMYLATSLKEEVSKGVFCRRAMIEQKLPPVLWVFHLDPKVWNKKKKTWVIIFECILYYYMK